MDISRSALEAEARVYESLKRAHTQRLKSQTKQTEDDTHAVAGRSSSTCGRLHQDSEAAKIPSNETQDPSTSITHQGTRARSAQARTTSESRLTVDDLARSFKNVPKSALEAQVREYERLHRIHARRVQSRCNPTKDDIGAAAGSGNNGRDSRSSTYGTLHRADRNAGIPSDDPQTSVAPSGNCSIATDPKAGQHSSSTHGTLHQANQTASIPSNDPQMSVALSGTCSSATDPEASQQRTASGNAAANGCGTRAGTKPLPEQCRSYGIPNKTKYHTKLVTCMFCSSKIYTDPSTAMICCQECGMSFRMEEVARWDRGTSDGRERP